MSQSHFKFTVMGVNALQTLEGLQLYSSPSLFHFPLPPSVADLGCHARGVTVEHQRHRGGGVFPPPHRRRSLTKFFFDFSGKMVRLGAFLVLFLQTAVI